VRRHDASTTTAAIVLAGAALLSGCGARLPNPPSNLSEYYVFIPDTVAGYPKRTVILHNLRRAADSRLSVRARLRSLRLIERLGAEGSEVEEVLSLLLRDPTTPAEIRMEARLVRGVAARRSGGLTLRD